MADKNKADKDAITEREAAQLVLALKCLKSGIKIDIDYDKFAQVAGFKNKSVASVVWGRIRRKLDRISSDMLDSKSKSPDGFDSESSPVSTKKTAGKKRKAADESESPSAKSSKKSGKGTAKQKSEPQDIGVKPEPTSDEDAIPGAVNDNSDDDKV